MRDQAVSYVRLIAQHASAAFDRSNIALLGVIDQLRPDDMIVAHPLPEQRRKEIDALLRNYQQRTTGVVAMFLVDADGNFTAHSQNSIAAVNVGDRTYFQTLMREPQTVVAVSEAALDPMTKSGSLTIGRRVDLPDGSFGGMVSATLRLAESIADFYLSLPPGKDAAITLRDPENRLLVRYPVVEAKLGQPVATSGWIRERLLAGDKEGVITIASNIDGIERTFAFRRLPNYPIHATIGLSLEESLTGWQSERNIFAAGTLLLLLAGGFITVVLRRNQRAEEALARESFHNRMLLRHASEGVCILDEKGNTLPNRSLFYDRLTQGIILAKRERCELALLYLDLDRFKAVNDELGHEAGDEVLKTAAARIRRLLRESDTVARIGGDEFTVILPRIASRKDAAEVAIKIIDALAAPFQLSDSNGNACKVRIGCSVGIDRIAAPITVACQRTAAFI